MTSKALNLTWNLPVEEIRKNCDNEFVSPKFEAFPNIWYYLKLRSKNNHNTMYVSLQMDMSKPQMIKVEFSLSMPHISKDQKLNGIFQKTGDSYGADICNRGYFFDPTKLKKTPCQLILKGTATILSSMPKSVMAIVRPQEVKPVPKGPALEASLGQELWKNGDKDFLLIVEHRPIKVHQLVMKTRSSVLARMLENGKKELITKPAEIKEFSFKVVEAAVHHSYDLNILDSLDDSGYLSLIEFANMYDMVKLKNDVEALLCHRLSGTNVCDFSNFSVNANLNVLKKACLDFLIKSIRSNTPFDHPEKLNTEITKEVIIMLSKK